MIIFLVFVSLFLGLSLQYAYLSIAFVAIIFLIFVFKRFNRFLALVSLGVMALGFSMSFINVSYQKNTYEGVVYVAKDNYFLFNSGGERLYVYGKNHSYDVGDILSISGEKEKLDFTLLESDFDFNDYLYKRGVFHLLRSNKITVKFHNFIRIKERREKLLQNFNSVERSIVSSILFSETEESSLSNDLNNLHLARFLAASGLYITAFASLLNYVLKIFMKDKIGEAITIVLVLLYSIFTFPRFAIIRVSFLLIFKWINKYLLNKKFSYIELLSLLGIFFLLTNPYLARQDSFILGFAIPIISYLLRDIYPNNKIKRSLAKSFAIYLFFLPFEISYFNRIVIFSLPFQILSMPLFIVIGIISILCFFYIPLISVDKFLISVLQKIVQVINPLNFAILLPNLNEFVLLLYESIYVFYIYYLSLGVKPFIKFSSFALISIMILYSLPINNALSSEVTFINVGQGDCTLIRYHNHVSLIDSGGLNYKDIAQDVLVPYLSKKRIYHIENVFITHYDEDHYGALSSLRDNYRIDNIYDYNSTFPIKMGEIVFTNYNTYGTNSEDENERSLVLGFKALNLNFLIMGDAPKLIEKKIVDQKEKIKCDILKVGHHGSDSSSSDKFINYLQPKIAIISCGKNNSFGHPSKSVIATLKKYKIQIRRTDLEGTITFKKMFI